MSFPPNSVLPSDSETHTTEQGKEKLRESGSLFLWCFVSLCGTLGVWGNGSKLGYKKCD